MAKSTMVCAGIDTGKRKLDVALAGALTGAPTGAPTGALTGPVAAAAAGLRFDNDAAGHASLLRWLRRHRVRRVGIEASGGYEAPVVAALRRAGFVVIVFQPAQVRAYARFVLQRAKNDRIDAALIARCTA